MMRVDLSKPIAAGLRFRSWAETAGDTLAWRRTIGEQTYKHGISREREAGVLSEILKAES